MAAVDDLQSAYNQMATRMKEITASPKPSYSIDGESYSWAEYQSFLLTGMKQLREEIAAASNYPYELHSQGFG